MGRKAPLTQRMVSMVALSSHFSPMASTMNSRAMAAMPNITGKERKEVKRSILRNTRTCC